MNHQIIGKLEAVMGTVNSTAYHAIKDAIKEIKSLSNQLTESKQTALDHVEIQRALRQQLSAALAACKLKDEALQQEYDYQKANDIEIAFWIEEALATQPDDSALKAWLGEPIGEVKKHTGSLKDMAIIVWSGEQPAEGTKLYSPKELK